jgi:DNA-binding protein Fis
MVNDEKSYIYSFWNDKNEIIYIGKTHEQLLKRMKGHGHLPQEAYRNTIKIKYFELDSKALCDISEIVLINTYHPIYNTNQNYTEEKIDNAFFLLCQQNWIEIDSVTFQYIDFKSKGGKENKVLLTPEEIKIRQREGIEKAKQEGKYTGRQHKKIDWEFFGSIYDQMIRNKISKEKMAKLLGVSRPTVYKYIAEYEEMKKNGRE